MKLVVADLTGSNPNVAYELAVRHAFNKVSIHLIDKAEKIPFDLKDERTIVFDLSDPDSNNRCKVELRRSVTAIFKDDAEYTSPIFRTLGVAAATTEEKAGFLETLADRVDQIASDVGNIETTLMLADLDEIGEISDIKGGVEALMKEQLDIRKRHSEIAKALKAILEKLG